MTPPALARRDLRLPVTQPVTWAPALSMDPNQVDDAELRAATADVLSRPIDMFLATTGIGMKTWFAAADAWAGTITS